MLCIGLDQERLKDAINSRSGSADITALLQDRCPYVFSARPVFLATQLQQMSVLIRTVEEVLATAPGACSIQTTNFRTECGGFAPVYEVPALQPGCGCVGNERVD